MKKLIAALFIAILMLPGLSACNTQSNQGFADYPAVDAMPVFRNHLRFLFDNDGLPDNVMVDMASSIVMAMGQELQSVVPAYNSIWPGGITVSGVDIEVTIERNGHIQLFFVNGIDSDYPHLQFADILGYRPTAGDGLVDRTLEASFNNPHFVMNDDGTLSQINVFPPRQVVLTDRVGDFPIISPAEAIERMLANEGSFGVNMGQSSPMADDVLDIKLVYFGHSLGRNLLQYFAPWYEITIQTADVHHIQHYFVPAIRSDYLESNPEWAVYPHQ